MSKTYALVYYGGGMPEGEEAQQAVTAAWLAWFGKLGERVVDGGNPFGPSAVVGSATPASGATGYSIITAEDLADATALVEDGHPHIGSGNDARVEVYEVFPAM
ncbi:MAG: hypothetical protein ABI310_03890 [Microbacteriaceae bacterium]